VTGVILNLAVWFGLHTLFARLETIIAGPLHLLWPDWSSIDPISLALTLLAALMLFRLKLGTFRTLGVCAVLGFAARYVGS